MSVVEETMELVEEEPGPAEVKAQTLRTVMADAVLYVMSHVSVGMLHHHILRVAAFVLTLQAAIVMGVAKDWHQKALKFPAARYFLSANVIVAAYSIASVVLSVMSRRSLMILGPALIMADVIALAFLFTANGAACELAENDGGDMHGSIAASIVLSMTAATVYLALVFSAVLAIHKKVQPYSEKRSSKLTPRRTKKWRKIKKNNDEPV